MKLEHSELKPFEPILDGLHRLVFEGGIEALQKADLLRDPEDLMSVIDDASANRRFLRGCHYGWELAQRKISALVIEYENEIRRLKQEMKAKLRERDRSAVERLKPLINCLASRQLVLRRLADAILYQMFRMQHWVIRHASLDHDIHRIDPRVLERTARVASNLNSQERLRFHLVADLTTVVHVGDLVRVERDVTPPRCSLIELKEGRVNSVLSEIIDQANGKLGEEQLTDIEVEFGGKAAQQALRMARQEFRHKEFFRLINTDEGIDIMLNRQTRFLPEIVHVKDYAEALREMCAKASSSGVEVRCVDNCLRLIALNRSVAGLLGSEGIAHLLYHFQFDVHGCTLSAPDSDELVKAKTIFPFFDLLRLNLRAMWPPPIFVWPMSKDLIFDLLFGRIFIFAQLDFDKLFGLAQSQGIEMTWAKDKEIGLREAAELIPGSPNARGVKVKLRGGPHDVDQILFGGFFGRTFLEFMSPAQLLELVVAGFSRGWEDKKESGSPKTERGDEFRWPES